jgi:Bor protein
MQLPDTTVPAINRYLRSWCAAACMAGLLALSGCATYQVTVPDSDPIRVEGQTAAYQSKTMHAFFWGLLLHPQVLSAECYGQGINDVVVFRTWLHDYVGVVTLGLWMPTQVRFRCKAPPTRPGALPGARKRSRGIS